MYRPEEDTSRRAAFTVSPCGRKTLPRMSEVDDGDNTLVAWSDEPRDFLRPIGGTGDDGSGREQRISFQTDFEHESPWPVKRSALMMIQSMAKGLVDAFISARSSLHESYRWRATRSPGQDVEKTMISATPSASRLRQLSEVFGAFATLVVALTVIQEILKFAEPDSTFVHLMLEAMRANVGVVVIICCLSSHYLSIRKLRAAMRLSDSSEETRKRHAREYRVVAGHWTAASSPDIFGETVDLLLDSQMLVVGIGWIFIVYVPAAIIWSQYSLQDSNAYLIGACCPGDELTPACDQLCRHGVNVAEGCLTQALGCGLSMSSFVVIIPPKIWSPTTFVAAKQTNNGIIIRILWALEPCLIQMILNYGLFLFYILTFIMTETFQVPDVWRMVLIIFPTMSGLQVTLFLWVIGCRHLIRMPVRLYHSIKGTFRKVGKLKVHPDTDCRGGCNCEIKHEAPRLWECRGSWRYRQLVLMICIFGSFGADANRHMPNIKYHFIWHLWLVRILMLAFFFVSRDEESDFHVLEHQGPGLGLLLDARQLRRAVVGHLKGRKHLIATKVRQYKATLMRMEETLAISYRWHPLVAQLGNGMEVNMSKWQLEAMVEAIDETRCLYVWIDKFSVPQDVYSTLQRTLISRMMSVYSSAHVTAALLSSEVETSRYCQRMWTIQEFCTSPQLLVKIQETRRHDGPCTHGECKHSVMGKEAKFIQKLRHQHLGRQPECTPVWLLGDTVEAIRNVDVKDAIKIFTTYKYLCSWLHCKHRWDTIPALYPLLWNMPTENQAELSRVLRAIEAVHGLSQKNELMLLHRNSVNWMRQSSSPASQGGPMGTTSDCSHSSSASGTLDCDDILPTAVST